jgi:hypothetical protein
MLAAALAMVLAYNVTGDDVYRVGKAASTARIVYSGTQSLSAIPQGRDIRFVVTAQCTRTDDSGSATERASFVQEMLPDGSFEDRVDADPDFLTILNQPFAVELDRTTIRDLQELHTAVPFAAASPVGGGNLRGTLSPYAAGMIHGRPVIGVKFVADGAVSGALPQRPLDVIDGRIHLDGTAYYGTRHALLLALSARLTIAGMLETRRLAPMPVRIVYERAIKMR